MTPKPPKNSKQYAGPGSFVPLNDQLGHHHHSRQNSDAIALQPPVDLYVAPYEINHNAALDNLSQGFSEFGVSGSRRRESFPVSPVSLYF